MASSSSSAAPRPRWRVHPRFDRTAWVGRDTEVAALREMAAEGSGSLVQVVGPPQSGKSRLVFETLAAAQSDSPVHWIGAAELCSVDDLLACVAEWFQWQVDIDPGSREVRIADAAAQALTGWLVVDGLARDEAGVREALAAWAAASGATILVTSVSLRDVEGPFLRLSGLNPDAARDLFTRCAVNARSSFDASAHDAALIDEIVEALNRAPGAIIAAARKVRTFTPDQILTRLREDLRSDTPDTQWIARALERPGIPEVARSLTVFADGFTLDEAAEVVAADDLDVHVEWLADESLLEVEFAAPGDSPRYRMSAPAREAVTRRFGPADAATREAFSARYTTLAIRCLESLPTDDGRFLMESLWKIRKNVVAAADDLESTRPADAARAMLALAIIAGVRGHYPESDRCFAGARALGGPELRVLVAVERARILSRAMRLEELDEALREALEAPAADDAVTHRIHAARAHRHWFLGEREEAVAAIERAKRHEPSPLSTVTLAVVEGLLATERGDDGVEMIARSIEGFVDGAHPLDRGYGLVALGCALFHVGRMADARERFATAAAAAEAHHDAVGVAAAHLYLGAIAAAGGDHTEAIDHYTIGTSRLTSSCGTIAMLELLRAASFAAENEALAAARSLARARHYADESPRLRLCFDLVEPLLAAASGDVSGARASIARARHRASSLPGVIRVLACEAYEQAARGLETSVSIEHPTLSELPEVLAILASFQGLHRPDATTLAQRGDAFVLGGVTVDLTRRRTLQRVMRALVDGRGQPLSVEDLFRAGWPGQKAHPSSAAKRVYTCVWELRKLGLGPAITSDADGYRLASSVRLVR